MQSDRTAVVYLLQSYNTHFGKTNPMRELGVGEIDIAPLSRSADAAIETLSRFRSPQLAASLISTERAMSAFDPKRTCAALH